MTKPKATTPSLVAYAYDRRAAERRATCAVCKLPEGIRAEVKQARARKVPTNVIDDWLRSKRFKVDRVDWNTHSAGLHELREARRPE